MTASIRCPRPFVTSSPTTRTSANPTSSNSRRDNSDEWIRNDPSFPKTHRAPDPRWVLGKEGSFRIHSSELSLRELLEVGFADVRVVGLEVTKGRGHRIEAVIGEYHRLRVLQLGECFHVEPEVRAWVVTLGGGDVRTMRNGLPGQKADAGIVPAFRKAVADLELIFAPAEFARDLRGEVIGECEEYFCTERLEQCAPRFPGHRGLERADALRGDDRDALRLAREAEKLFVACGLILADRHKVLVFVTEKNSLPEMEFREGLNVRDAVQERALKIELHHDPQGPGEARVQRHREIESDDRASFDQRAERRKGSAKPVVCVGLGVVAFSRRAECPFDGRVIIEE